VQNLPVLGVKIAGFGSQITKKALLTIGTEFAVLLENVENVCSKRQINKEIYDYQQNAISHLVLRGRYGLSPLV
jgi:hypothetical protein